jgi:ribonuclease BN (tRNA processing enzyme)
MELEVLGNGVGAPLGNGCSSYAVRSGSTLLLLDFGPGACERAWERDLLGSIDAIVISHMHLDHMLDLLPLALDLVDEAVRSRNPEPKRPALYVARNSGPQVLFALADAVALSPSRFEEAFDLREYDESDTLEIGDLRLSFGLTAHSLPGCAPRVTDGRSTLFYSADTAYRDHLVEHARGADLALLESSYVEGGEQLELQGHMTGEQAGQFAAAAGAGRLVLTHTMPFADENEANLRRARAVFGGDVDLATRGAVYSF